MKTVFRSTTILLLAFAAVLTPGVAQAAAPTNSEPPLIAQPFPLPAIYEVVDLPTLKKICAHYGLGALWAKIDRDPPPLPFKSDGASGWFNEWKGVSLYPAAFLHDIKYWAGYAGEEVERLVAGAELMIDVARLLGSTEMAETMFHGVRLGGSEKLPTSFGWGFGRHPVSSASKPPAKPATNISAPR